jgi:nicotinate-nucleotide adenylyltransferase
MNLSQGGRRVAFFGGSFDPPHLGHLAVARAARAALALDTVLFAPVGAQPLKPNGSAAGFQDRVAMTRLAIAAEPDFHLSLADAPTADGAPNYTLETLLALRAELPAGGDLFCLMGADSLLTLRHWRRAAEIPFAAHLVAASRPGQAMGNLEGVLPPGLRLLASSAQEAAAVRSGVELHTYLLQDAAGRETAFYLLPGLHVDISATEIRQQMRSKARNIAESGIIPSAVHEYIRHHGLYR